MRAVLKTLFAAVSICLLASAAHAGDQGDPAQSCDGPAGLTARKGELFCSGFARPQPRAWQIHCVFMTVPLHFHDTPQAPAASSVSWLSPAKTPRQCRV